MAYFIKSASFSIGGTPKFSGGTNNQAVEFINGVSVKGIPTFYDSNDSYIKPVNLWFIHLRTVERAKNLNSIIRAIQRYWDFLEEHSLKWNKFPIQKGLKPTYIFRNNNLNKAIESGNIKASTAALYMNHVIKFYEWAMHEKLLNYTEDNRPFEIEYVSVANNSALGHVNRRFIVRSTDLRIKVPRKAEGQSLNPLSEDELKAFSLELRKKCWEFQLHQQLQLRCGLRVDEACSFPAELVKLPKNNELIEVEIGAHNGVRTKYNKPRVVEIHPGLMLQMHSYLISEHRIQRYKKENIPKFEPLLINRFKKPYSPNSVQNEFYYLRQNIRLKHKVRFKHRTHDLRATYGTYRLASLLSIEELSVASAMALLMKWMGHQNEKTTWKYLQYLEQDNAKVRAILFLDAFMDEALKYGWE